MSGTPQAPVLAVIGLGYVGLPLVVEFGKQMRTIGFDIAKAKVQACQAGTDPSRELSDDEVRAARYAEYTDDPRRLAEADLIIVAVPTPVDEAHIPDFGPLVGASTSVGRHMKRGATVVYESTVYPGATEEVCVPVLERESGLKWKEDFFLGYSPERINPGDKEHTLERIVKVVSGENPEVLERVAAAYASVVTAGVHRAPSIMVAEAAKVIENTQRDLNIALMNELAIIFDKKGIRTKDVLDAAGTKWNFLKFQPGLVGGHCIGVDPYYLTTMAEGLGYHPQVIQAGRRINDGMGVFIAQKLVKLLVNKDVVVRGARVGVLGLTFKENVPDLRNSRVPDIVAELRSFGVVPLVYDPHADVDDAMHEYGIQLVAKEELTGLDAVVLAVNHKRFVDAGLEALVAGVKPGGVVVDVKSIVPVGALPTHTVWSL
jgi:UDP-N-acetyl-D-galactosamine dehydrogenase